MVALSPRTTRPDGETVFHEVGRRAAARLRLSVPARLVTLYDTQSCVCIDISCTGARIALAKPLRAGEAGFLRIAQIEQFATIVRCWKGEDGGINALHFDTPISGQVVLAMRRYAETFEADEQRERRREVEAWVKGLI